MAAAKSHGLDFARKNAFRLFVASSLPSMHSRVRKLSGNDMHALLFSSRPVFARLTRAGICAGLVFSLGACGLFSSYKPAPLENALQPQRDQPAAKADPKEGSKAHLALAVNYFQSGQLDFAQDEAVTALKLDGKSSEAVSMLGIIAMAQKNYPVAQTNFEKALSLDPANADALNNLASVYCRTNRYDEGVQLYGKALATPGYTRVTPTLLNAATCLERKPDLDSAEKFLRVARKNDPNDTAVMYQLALLDLHANKPHEALFEIEAMRRREQPTSAVLWLQYLAARQAGDSQSASRASVLLQSQFPRSRETDQLMARDFTAPELVSQ